MVARKFPSHVAIAWSMAASSSQSPSSLSRGSEGMTLFRCGQPRCSYFVLIESRRDQASAFIRRRLLFLRAHPAQFLDLERWPSGFLGDFAILLGNERFCRLVPIQPAEKLGRHAPVGTLGAV